MSSFEIIQSDCRDAMRSMDASSVDAIVCDPPYGLSFMGKGWDHGVPGVEFWIEALRVAKPGAHLLAFGGTRTHHRLACAIEDAGWEIRDCVMWVYGSGFPKSHDVSKAIDKAAGAERKIVGTNANWRGNKDAHKNSIMRPMSHGEAEFITAPATDAARQWQGWGTALKPAWEPIIVARKPLAGTVAANVLAHGTGAINVDGCRVGMRTYNESGWSKTGSRASENRAMSGGNTQRDPKDEAGLGRWPANVIHDGSDEVVGLFPHSSSGANPTRRAGLGYHGGDGQAECVAARGAGSGSAARFFYCAKASKADRDEGCEGFEAIHRANGNKWTDQDYRVASGERPPSSESGPRRNHHPTVKPTALMRYLCRLVTPPGGLVLDPFCGSGSTGKAAILEGFRFVGVELEPEYADIARARIAAVSSSSDPAARRIASVDPIQDDREETAAGVSCLPLFDMAASA